MVERTFIRASPGSFLAHKAESLSAEMLVITGALGPQYLYLRRPKSLELRQFVSPKNPVELAVFKVLDYKNIIK